MENGELYGLNPKVIVILAGINNVGTIPGGDVKVENITRGLKALVSACQQKAPNATLILTALFPRNDNLAVMPTINRINDNLAQMADGKRVRYLNVNDKLADKDGKLFEGISKDKLHPSLKGYQIWADGLKHGTAHCRCEVRSGLKRKNCSPGGWLLLTGLADLN